MDLALPFRYYSLSNLIIVVTTQELEIYVKFAEGNNEWMQFLTTIPLNESNNAKGNNQANCLYFLYSVINDTSASFGTDCTIPNTNIQTPLLTLTYECPSLAPSPSCLYASFGLMPIITPQLRNIISVPQNGSSPYIFGIKEGPSRSATGRLMFCNFTLCQSLYISSNIVFLFDFDVFSTA